MAEQDVGLSLDDAGDGLHVGHLEAVRRDVVPARHDPRRQARRGWALAGGCGSVDEIVRGAPVQKDRPRELQASSPTATEAA